MPLTVYKEWTDKGRIIYWICIDGQKTPVTPDQAALIIKQGGVLVEEDDLR